MTTKRITKRQKELADAHGIGYSKGYLVGLKQSPGYQAGYQDGHAAAVAHAAAMGRAMAEESLIRAYKAAHAKARRRKLMRRAKR